MSKYAIDSDTKVTLYFTGCYGCRAAKKYDEIHQFVLDNRIKLGNFILKRIELNPEWQDEIKSYDVTTPAVLLENAANEKIILPYREFVKKYCKKSKESAKPQAERIAAGAVSGESPTAPSKKRKRAKNGNKTNHK